MKYEKNELILTMIASSLAGSLAKLVVHPIDTIKAKVQVNRARIEKLSDYQKGLVSETIRKTWKSYGLRGFFPGIGISIFGSTIAFSAWMTAYEFFKKKLSYMDYFNRHTTQNYFFSGFLAYFVSCIFWLPIDVIKERLQVQSELKIYSYKNSIYAAKTILQNEGIRGLYRAYGATLMFFGPYSAILLVLFEYLKKAICRNPKEPTITENVGASILASSVAGFLTNPLELTKLRMQIQRADVASKGGQISLEQSVFGYKNMFHGIYLIAKREGVLALFKGSLLRILFTAPNTTISLVMTEYFRQKIRPYMF